MNNKILQGNCLDTLKNLPGNFVDCCITSPPYFNLRNYHIDGQIGIEQTPEEYIEKLVVVFREVRRVLKAAGTLWLNIGDSYNGSGHGEGGIPAGKQATNIGSHNHRPTWVDNIPNKSLLGIPWRLAFALQNDGWILRNDIIWHKPNPMPESVTDRFTKSHEYLFLFSKQRTYYFNHDEAMEETTRYDGVFLRNKRDVWTVPTEACSEAHFAMFPAALITPCVKCGCPENGLILDPFFGAGTTGVVAVRYNRKYIGCELNPEYIKIAENRIKSELNKTALFNGVEGISLW